MLLITHEPVETKNAKKTFLTFEQEPFGSVEDMESLGAAIAYAAVPLNTMEEVGLDEVLKGRVRRGDELYINGAMMGHDSSQFWNSELERLTAMTRGSRVNVVAIDPKGDINTLYVIQRALLKKQELARRKLKFLPAQVYRSAYAKAGVLAPITARKK